MLPAVASSNTINGNSLKLRTAQFPFLLAEFVL